MTSYFPDLNAWMALSVADHPHSAAAWAWLEGLPNGARLLFCRYTQMGLLRLLTTAAVMGDDTLSLRQAWSVYDQWLEDVRVEFYPEPRQTEAAFRGAMKPLLSQAATKAIGDSYLLAFAKAAGATLVTFDGALRGHAARQGVRSETPGA